MSDLLDLCRTQARVLWEWRGGPASLVNRGLLTFIVATFSFAVTAWLVPGIEIANIGAAALAVILIGLFNALVRPVLLAIVAPWSLIAMGILVLVLQIVAFFNAADARSIAAATSLPTCAALPIVFLFGAGGTGRTPRPDRSHPRTRRRGRRKHRPRAQRSRHLMRQVPPSNARVSTSPRLRRAAGR